MQWLFDEIEVTLQRVKSIFMWLGPKHHSPVISWGGKDSWGNLHCHWLKVSEVVRAVAEGRNSERRVPCNMNTETPRINAFKSLADQWAEYAQGRFQQAQGKTVGSTPCTFIGKVWNSSRQWTRTSTGLPLFTFPSLIITALCCLSSHFWWKFFPYISSWIFSYFRQKLLLHDNWKLLFSTLS